MRNGIAVVVLAAVAVVGALGVHAGQQPAPAQKEPAKATSASHSTSGVVQSVNDNSLVIKHKDATMTFELNAQTQREGKIDVGSTVSVRFREEGKTRIATAVTAETKTAQAKPKGH